MSSESSSHHDESHVTEISMREDGADIEATIRTDAVGSELSDRSENDVGGDAGGNDSNEASTASDDSTAHAILIKNLEQEAKNDLISSLRRKGLPEESANHYKITIRVSKPRSRDNKKKAEQSCSTIYTAPDGSLFLSKTDVINDIIQNSRSATDSSQVRVQAHEAAKLDLKGIALPATFGSIKVLSWGEIDKRLGFHSPSQLWPVGYRCQQTVEGSTLNGVKKQEIICQIGVSDAGFPQFHIYNPSTDGTYLASLESNVWRKFNPQNVDNSWNPSFFNFDIELLLEGLPNALECDEYKLHCERGYGKSYFTEEEAIAAKSIFLAKLNREKRTQDRQKRQSMSTEEIARNAALQKLKEAEDIELAKEISVKSKLAREAEKEEIRKIKEVEQKEKEEKRRIDAERRGRQKEDDRFRREGFREEDKQEKGRLREWERAGKEKGKENERLDREKIRELERMEREKLKELGRSEKEKVKEMEKIERERARETERLEKERIKESEKWNREKQKEAERLQKEKVREAERLEKDRLKQFDKQRVAIRKELNNEIRKLRADLSTLILQNFDREEEIEEGVLPPEFSGIDLQSNEMVEGVTVPQIMDRSGIVLQPSILSNGKQEIWDRLFYVLSGINLMRQHIGIDKRYSLDDFNKIIISSMRDTESKVPDSYFEAQLDRIELNLTKLLLPDLHTFMELDEREGDPSRRKDKRQGACTFPLNQLTWTELARMVLLNYVLSALGRIKEDRQHGIRGSKLPNFRLTKNVIRNIRYQWYLRASHSDSSVSIGDQNIAEMYATHFDHLAAIQWCNNKIEMSCKEYEEAKPYPIIFDSEQEMEQKLKECIQSDEYPEVYKRCCKVILRVLDLRSVENFMWEVDREAFPDYYTTIRRPIYLSSIASKLVEKGYGYESDRPELVADRVFAELKQMYVNCVTYNTEYQTIVAQAAKMYTFTHHLFLRWLYDPDKPSLEQCTENYCLLSGAALVNSTKSETIRCGKCQHNFHFPTLEDILHESPSAPTNSTVQRLRQYILEPTPEMYTSINEEWHCPFCLQEDSTICREKFAEAGIPLTEVEFFVNEWGMSSCLPWIFSEKYSGLMDYIRQHDSYLELSVEALKVLSSPNKTSRHPSGEYKLWTPAERITVLMALFEVMQSTPKALEHLKRIHDDCAGIMRMCAKASFREADFMTSVRDLGGEDAMKCCRVLLDGLDSEPTTEPYLQSFLTEGRCLVCNTSTYEEDEDEDPENGDANATTTSENPVILCDGCNAEVHLKCLGLAAVPNDAWYCTVCVERQARRDRVSTTVENVDQWRDKEEEDRLLNEFVNSKIPELCRPTGEYSVAQCSYCGMTEFEICSPFVIGQSRNEHDDWVAAMARVPIAANLLFPQSNCNINFLHNGTQFSLPKLSCPNFPIENSEEGKKLLEMYEAVNCKPVIVHQLCALQMFQARSNRSRHLLRRRRNIVGEKALSMSGISQQPLGYDVYHNEYWKFPFCSDLFVKVSGLTEPSQSKHAFSEDQRDFYKMIGHDAVDTGVSTATNYHWIRIHDLDAIKSIASLLGNSLVEQQLRLNLIKEVIVDKTLQTKDSSLPTSTNLTANETSLTSAVSTTNLSTQDLPTNATDGHALTSSSKKGSVDLSDTATPVALKLYLTKGVEVPSSVMIQEEAAFVDSDNVEGINDGENPDEDDEGLNHLSFNTKSKKYFAVGLMNSSGGLVKTANLPLYGNYTIVYQIHREGYSKPVATASLSEPWTDHMYYFCTLLFKKSGNYTVSFLVEGTNKAGSIRPLIFPVVVHASSVRCGLPDALHRLQARHYIDNAQRQIILHRRELMAVTQRPVTEFAVIKAALVSLYLALPFGALSDSENTTIAASSSRGGVNSSGNKACSVAPSVQLLEPNGWSAALELAWKDAIIRAQSVWEVMECVLVLEFYLNRTWLVAPNSRLLSALPSTHFAMRAVTMSSIALRIYSIDKALAYEKVQVVARELRALGASSAGGTSASASWSAAMSVDDDGRNNSHARNHGTSSAKKGRAARYSNRSTGWDAPLSPPARTASSSGRSRRSVANKRINYREADEDEDEENEGEVDDEGGTRKYARKTNRRVSAMDVDEEEEEEADDDDGDSYERDDSDEEDEEEEEQDSNEEDDEEVTTAAAPSIWICSACGTENSARARSCDACQARKPAITIAKSSKNRQSRAIVGAGQKRTRVDRRFAPARKRGRRSSSSTGRRRGRFDDDEEDDHDDDDEEEEEEEDDEDNSVDNSSEPQFAERPSRSIRAAATGSDKKYNFDDDDDEEAEFDAPVSRRTSSTPAKSKKKTPEEIEFELYVEDLPMKIETLSQQMKEFQAEETDGNVDLFVRAMSLVRMLLKDVRSQAFWEPVDLAAVPSYSNYVHEPMDLGTILSRLRFRAYADEELPTAFVREVRLVFQNCQAFNVPGSLLFEYSVELEKKFERYFQEWVVSADRPAEPDMFAKEN